MVTGVFETAGVAIDEGQVKVAVAIEVARHDGRPGRSSAHRVS